MGSKLIEFNAGNSEVSEENLRDLEDRLQTEVQNMREATEKGYDDPRASINLPGDEKTLKQVKKLVKDKRRLNPEYLVVAGIGGSNLGTIAVQEAVLGKLYNQKNPDTKVLYAETTDSEHIGDILDIIESSLERGKTVLLNGVSKSGGTTETISNFEVIAEKISEYKNKPEQYITVTSQKNSPFHSLAEEKKYSTLEIPEKIGGRYSVFSAVSLYPLGILGVDLDELLEGAKQAKERCLNKDVLENPAARSAASVYLNQRQGRDIHDFFLYGKDLEMIGKWYRQLTGESLGKEQNREGKKVNAGITPIASVGSTDLHSMYQLYMGGPDDKLHTFVYTEENDRNVEVPENPEYSRLVEDIQGKPLDQIMDAIFEGVNNSFKDTTRPFNVVKVLNKSENSIGALLQFKMMEMMYLGYLMNVNPFNQPSVEDYKNETREILKENGRNG